MKVVGFFYLMSERALFYAIIICERVCLEWIRASGYQLIIKTVLDVFDVRLPYEGRKEAE